MSESQDDPLGYSEEAAGRLTDQGALIEESTADVFRRAGLRPGTQALDVGAGLLPRMVGAWTAAGGRA